jgi:hypothetical protein
MSLQEDANLHAAAADPANRRPPRQGPAKFDTVIDWQLVGEVSAEWRCFDRHRQFTGCCGRCSRLRTVEGLLLTFTVMQALGRPAKATQTRYFNKHGSMTAQLSAQLAAQPAAQHTLGFGHALLGEVLHVPAFSAAGDPRLAGVTSLRVRTAVVRSDGKVDLTHAIAGASYALDFDKTITRSQLVAVRSPSSGRSYLGNVLELHCASLLGTGNGLDARGKLLVAEADLQPFEVRCVRRHVLAARARAVILAGTEWLLLIPAHKLVACRWLGMMQLPCGATCCHSCWMNMQCKLRSIISDLCAAAYRLGPALLAIAGVDCFDPSVSWAHGSSSHGGVLNVDKWCQVSIAGGGASSVQYTG